MKKDKTYEVTLKHGCQDRDTWKIIATNKRLARWFGAHLFNMKYESFVTWKDMKATRIRTRRGDE